VACIHQRSYSICFVLLVAVRDCEIGVVGSPDEDSWLPSSAPFRDFTGKPAVLSNKFYKYDGKSEYHPARKRGNFRWAIQQQQTRGPPGTPGRCFPIPSIHARNKAG
jgi:hypothetical protein